MSQDVVNAIDGLLKEEYRLLTDASNSDSKLVGQLKYVIRRRYKIELREQDLQKMYEEFVFKSIFDLISQTPVNADLAKIFGYNHVTPLYGQISEVKTAADLNAEAKKIAGYYFKNGIPKDTSKIQNNFEPFLLTYFASCEDKNEKPVSEYTNTFYNEVADLVLIHSQLGQEKTLEYVNELPINVNLMSLPLRRRIAEIRGSRNHSYDYFAYAALSILGHASLDPDYLTEENFQEMSNRVSFLFELSFRAAREKKIYLKQDDKDLLKDLEDSFGKSIESEVKLNKIYKRPAEHVFSRLLAVAQESFQKALAKYKRLI